jgi:ribonuclease HI
MPRLPIMLALDYEIQWEFFDKACQGHPPACGVGVVLHLKKDDYIHIHYALENDTNNRAEFISLWTLLEIVVRKVIKKLQVMGDSKMVIEWERKKANVHNIRLESLLQDIKLSFQSFEWLSFNHILCELNEKEDSLSKESLQLLVGAFGYYEFIEGEEIEAMEFRL